MKKLAVNRVALSQGFNSGIATTTVWESKGAPHQLSVRGARRPIP
jgi:hypothetical protein